VPALVEHQGAGARRPRVEPLWQQPAPMQAGSVRNLWQGLGWGQGGCPSGSWIGQEAAFEAVQGIQCHSLGKQNLQTIKKLSSAL
jgi:hypothetical protein